MLSAGALPLSSRPLTQWCFESYAESGMSKQPHQLVAQFTEVADSTKLIMDQQKTFRQLWCVTLCKASPTTNAVVVLALL